MYEHPNSTPLGGPDSFSVLLMQGRPEDAGHLRSLARRLVEVGGAVVTSPVEHASAAAGDLEVLSTTIRASSGLPVVLLGHGPGALFAACAAQLCFAELHALVLSEPDIDGAGDRALVQRMTAGPSLGPLPTLWIHGSPSPGAASREIERAIGHVRGPALEECVLTAADDGSLLATDRRKALDAVVAFVLRTLRWEAMLR